MGENRFLAAQLAVSAHLWDCITLKMESLDCVSV